MTRALRRLAEAAMAWIGRALGRPLRGRRGIV